MAIKREACDIWFSKAIRLRDKRCLHCGKDDRLENCHVVGRRNKRLRWSAANCIAMCHGCHRYMTEQPLEFYEFLRGILGEAHVDNLRLVSNEIYKTTRPLRAEIATHYRLEVQAMEADENHELQTWN